MLKLNSQFYVFLLQQHGRPLKIMRACIAVLCRVVWLLYLFVKCTVALLILVLCITSLCCWLGLMAVMAYFPGCSVFLAVPKAIKNTAGKKTLRLLLFNVTLILLLSHEADVFFFFFLLPAFLSLPRPVFLSQ